MQDRLLEEFGQQRGCFLSALGDCIHRKKTLEALTQMEPGLYTPEEWSYCLSYILDRRVVVHRCEDVALLLEEEIQAENQDTGMNLK